ncbi:hypothetical protein HXX76_016005 [Chlamydomonas incerta]|uniref:Uncharacterized protein n=1 Tax=Chlamydomonas incerta TaxID=51695 RepID=A0A835SM33_CHLIN|nr:hypothetical protein HXX76_016005 [Chlamydomonas incerta]|eukprot:KAG2422481.1 hypothetical protein HXX76_016005 [Chlamydomonas incerta]
MGVSADEATNQATSETTATTVTAATVQWLPSCQLLASRVCAPTLLSVGVTAAQAALAAAGAEAAEAQREAALLALHAATSEPGRKLLAASLAALRCAAAHPTNTSAVADCGRVAIAASPSAAAALVGALGPPPCAGLAATPAACAAAPGCRVVPHGDHSDCEPAAAYAAAYLTTNSTLPAAAATSSAAPTAAAAATEPTALAAAVQRLADSCAALLPLPPATAGEGAGLSSAAAVLACGRAELRGARVGAEQLAALQLVAEGEHHAQPEGDEEEEDGEEADGHDEQNHIGAAGAAAADGHAHEGEEHEAEEEADDAQNLRIASVFIVLTAALLGCTLPWVMRGWAERRPLLGAALRCMSAGVILCLALVHVATHAIEEMNGLLGGGGGGSVEGAHAGHGHRRLAMSLLEDAGGPAAASRRQLLQDTAAAAADAAGPQQLPYAGDLAGLLGLLDVGGLAAAAVVAEAGHEEEEVAESGNSAHQHPFPIGMCCVMFGFLLMAGAEMLVHAVIEARAEKAAAAAATRMYAAEKQRQKQAAAAGDHEAVAAADGAKAAAAAVPDVEAGRGTTQSRALGDDGCDMRLEVVAVGGGGVGGSASSEDCGGGGPPPVVAVVGLSTSSRLAGLAALFELGCVFHSFIIGLSLGVLTQRGEVAAMLVALCIHQFAEGISLVSILMAAGLAGWRLAGMGVAYAVMAPAGIAVGIAVSDSYDGESVTARAVQGTINGVSGGVLLYLAAVMIAAELSATATTAGGMAAAAGAAAAAPGGGGGCCGSPPPRRWRGWERALLFAIVCVSAAAFAVLAQWA